MGCSGCSLGQVGGSCAGRSPEPGFCVSREAAEALLGGLGDACNAEDCFGAFRMRLHTARPLPKAALRVHLAVLVLTCWQSCFVEQELCGSCGCAAREDEG